MITINPPSIVDGHDYIYPGDSALDKEAEDFEERLEQALEIGDWQLVPLLPNVKPTVFHLSHPTGELRRHIRDLATMVGEGKKGHKYALRRICALCLTRMRDAGGKYGGEHKFKRIPDEHGFHVVQPKDMDNLEQVNDGDLIDGLGWHVIAKLNPTPS